MRARLALGIAAVLAVAILLPVVAVVALGAYGSSLGGATVATGPGDAELLVFPSHGLPGSPLKVTGKHWPPRSNVAIQLQRPAATSDSLSKPLRLAEIITSRRGTFEINTTIPGSVIPFGARSVRIQAVGRKSNQPDSAVLSVPFDLDPYPNEITISVVDADTGSASPDTIVRIDDSFGQEIAVDTADETGDVSFAGIRPGKKRLTIRKVDYEIARASIEVPDAGQAAFQIALQKSPGRRLLFYAYGQSDTGETTVVGLDRASGLPVRERITVPDGRFAPASVPSWNLYQGFFLAVDEDSGSIGAGDVSALWAMGVAARHLRVTSSGFSFGAWHSSPGQASSLGDIIHTFWSVQVPVGSTHLCIVDPESGRIVRREKIGSQRSPAGPVVRRLESIPRELGYAFRGRAGTCETGERATIVENIPLLIAEAVGNPVRRRLSLILSSARMGRSTSCTRRRAKLTKIYPDDQLQSVVNAGERWKADDFGIPLTGPGCVEPGDRADRSGHPARFAGQLAIPGPLGVVHFCGAPELARRHKGADHRFRHSKDRRRGRDTKSQRRHAARRPSGWRFLDQPPGIASLIAYTHTPKIKSSLRESGLKLAHWL